MLRRDQEAIEVLQGNFACHDAHTNILTSGHMRTQACIMHAVVAYA